MDLLPVPRIRALPPQDIGRIRSSATITGLNGVILELLKNSLDSHASIIMIKVDFRKGSCMVEDDGYGVPPVEFHKNGGLGKLYHTSKLDSQEELYGGKGTFLSSLISLALVIFTSRHASFEHSNSLVFYQSEIISRLCPAPAHHELTLHPRHGSRVTVSELFGNIPVRVKHRAQTFRRNEDMDREWDELKRLLTGVLIAFQKPVKVSILDTIRSHKLVFRGGQPRSPLSLWQTLKNEPNSQFDLDRIRSILNQANYITPLEFSSWVTASARTSELFVHAAISLEPSPTKQVQFISFGINPVNRNGPANILFSEINNIFNQSTFGVTNIHSQADSDPQPLGLGEDLEPDFTYSKSKSRSARSKGVNKWPMFYVRISINRRASDCDPESGSLAPEISIQKVINVVSLLFYRFLQENNFSPRRLHRPKNLNHQSKRSTPTLHRQPEGTNHLVRDCTTGISDDIPTRNVQEVSAGLGSSSGSDGSISTRELPVRDFGVWSKARSGKGVVHGYTVPRSNEKRVTPLLEDEKLPTENYAVVPATCFPPPELVQSERMNDSHLTSTEIPTIFQLDQADGGMDGRPVDGTLLWTDPLTKQDVRINQRTGQVLTPSSLIRRDPAKNVGAWNNRKSLEHGSKIKSGQTPTPWFDSILENWTNPVFPNPDQPLQSVVSGTYASRTSIPRGLKGCCHSPQDGLSEPIDGRLDRKALREARVIAQVDNKFILLSILVPASGTGTDELLILVDQHAADERCRVEELFAELCGSSPSHTVNTTRFDAPIIFRVSAQEANLFEARSGYFTSWGCRYDVLREAEGRYHIAITHLPTLIAERCRLEPRLAIDMLRSELWDQAGELGTVTRYLQKSPEPHYYESTVQPTSNWLHYIGRCPKKMVDLINSRACRSAVMFNDPLSVDECSAIVSKLSTCVLPFQCAHGRPSMVPIINLGPEVLAHASIGESVPQSSFGISSKPQEPCVSKDPGLDFVGAFKKWQHGSA
ncbi:DNA mismatch repair protein [Myotisia sp. PD_48]|nr:DNA mismatch repair protein [Myotisia sp. PD_48]